MFSDPLMMVKLATLAIFIAHFGLIFALLYHLYLEQQQTRMWRMRARWICYANTVGRGFEPYAGMNPKTYWRKVDEKAVVLENNPQLLDADATSSTSKESP